MEPVGSETIATRPIWFEYKPGGTTKNGVKIEQVIVCANSCVVFLGENQVLGWELNARMCVDSNESIRQATELMTQARGTIRDRRALNHGLTLIGTALATALEERTPDDSRDFYAGAREYIDRRQREGFHIHYLIWTFVTVAVAIGVGMIVWRQGGLFAEFSMSCMLGAIGALVSVAQRFRSVPVERYSSSLHTAIGAVSRVVLGCLFGGLLLLLHKADLVLHVANGQPYMLAAASFVAGICERLIPDILGQSEPGTGA